MTNGLGYDTDLMVLRLGGSRIERDGDVTVVRTAHNPSFRWGNFLLLHRAPEPTTGETWISRFRREFPHADRVCLGVAGDGAAEPALPGFETESDVVLTASADAVTAPPPASITVRPLCDDEDWAQALQVQLANADDPSAEYERFAGDSLRSARAVCERGQGAWWGGFHRGRMVGGAGLFWDGSGIARYQSVDTVAEFRSRGIASAVIAAAAAEARAAHQVERLVIVADPAADAIRLYRRLGFADHSRQWRLTAPLPGGAA